MKPSMPSAWAGQIDELSNKRVVIGCFPWKLVEGESCISRIVAFDGFEDV